MSRLSLFFGTVFHPPHGRQSHSQGSKSSLAFFCSDEKMWKNREEERKKEPFVSNTCIKAGWKVEIKDERTDTWWKIMEDQPSSRTVREYGTMKKSELSNWLLYWYSKSIRSTYILLWPVNPEFFTKVSHPTASGKGQRQSKHSKTF